jgi:hypothetical protein
MAGSKSAARAHAMGARPVVKSCAAVTCCERVYPGHIFCANHWFSLPRWMRVAIIDTFADADWDAHQEAIRIASDQIDGDFSAARLMGMQSVVSARLGTIDGPSRVFAGRRF